jgi:chlorophyllide a reductase subunit Y
VHTHARAKDIVVDSLVWRLPPQRKTRSGVNLIGEVFPNDPIAIDTVLRRLGTHVNTHVPGPRWSDYVAMVDGALNAPLHPFYSESVKRMKMKQGLAFVEGAPVGIDGTSTWIRSVGEALKIDAGLTDGVARDESAKVRAAMADYPLSGKTIMVAGYEGHEFLLVRLLIEAGAKVPYLSTAVNTNPLARQEEAWLAERGCTVLYGANFDDEIGALTDHPYDLVVGTTPLCAHAKELGIPAIYYTNALATRSMMLAEGAADVLRLITATLLSKPRYDMIAKFFADGDTPTLSATSWTAPRKPTIDLTTHLVAGGHFDPAATA